MDIKSSALFSDLFVLELANNHLGHVDRGLKIIDSFSKIVQKNQVRAAIKLQFREVESYIHEKFQNRTDIRYINKTQTTRLSKEDFACLVNAIKKSGCIPMATPFDEASVDLCIEFQLPIIKIASSSIQDSSLIEKIAQTKKPVIVSTGGASLEDIDKIVTYFTQQDIPIAINHCVSLYPSEDNELDLNQIDFLKHRYPAHTIGFSTHEYHDWSSSLMIAYAKGARTFERHIDIDDGTSIVSPYCSQPEQIDAWFKAYNKARLMCGSSGDKKRYLPEKELHYLDTLTRGIYAKRDLKKGSLLTKEDIYAVIPLQNGQISYREFQSGEIIKKDIPKDSPIQIEDLDCSYAQDSQLKSMIDKRGLCIEE